MNEEQFFASREADWMRLNRLCVLSSDRLGALSDVELEEFASLYRRVVADLALAQTQSTNEELIAFLGSLVRRAYGNLYRAKRRSVWAAISEAPAVASQTFRRKIWFFVASVSIFLAGVLFPYITMQVRPDLKAHFVDPDSEIVKHWVEGEFEERTGVEALAMTGFYSANNPRVAIIAGVVAASTFGFGTAYLMYLNGTAIGSLASEMHDHGRLSHLLIWIFPHGATELTAAFISGMSGLCLGWALIAPGRRTRGDALREAGKDAFVLLMLSFVMMFIAAPFEGFFSFNPRVPDIAKVIVGCVVLAGWIFYFYGYARVDESPNS